MPAMSTGRLREFLTEGTRTLKLATTRADGRPHVVPVWFVLDGDDLVITTATDSVKGRALRRGGTVSLCVDDDRPPYAFAAIEASVTTTEDQETVLRWASANAARYMGDDRADEYGRLNAGPGNLVARLTPTHVVAEDDVTGE